MERERSGDDQLRRRSVLRGVAATGLAIGGLSTTAPVAANDDGGVEDLVEQLSGNNGGDGGSSGTCAATVAPTDGENVTHTSIQAAIDDVSPSPDPDPQDASTFTIICIRPGVYDESVTIDKEGITLYGTGGADSTTVRAGGTVVDVTAEWGVLFGLTIEAKSGTAVDAAPRTVVQQSRVVTADTIGIDAQSHVFPIDNEFVDVGDANQQGIGIDVSNTRGTTSSDVDGIFVVRNTFDDYRHPIRITDSTEALIRKNTFNLARYSAIQIEATAGSTTSLLRIEGNTFNRNANGIILHEAEDGGRIKDVTITGNRFDDFVWGVLTSHKLVPFDFDRDGEKEMVEAPGELRAGPAFAHCNWWGDPKGPNAGDNNLAGSPAPNWIIPRQLKGTMPSADKVVPEGVDYQPWAIQPEDPGEEAICIGQDPTP